MLAARAWVVGAMRSRLMQRYPDLSPEEINLKVLEEIDRVKRRQARPQPVPQSRALSPDVMELWESIKLAARTEAGREGDLPER